MAFTFLQYFRKNTPAKKEKKTSSQGILSLTWPQTIMMLLQFLVSFTDVIVAGHINADTQAALGLITRCQLLMLVVVSAMSNGGVAAMSQALGAGLPKRAARYIGMLFKVGIVFCLFTLFVGYFFRHQLLWMLSVPDSIYDLTEDIWSLFLLIIPASYLTTITISIFRSRKNVMVPLASGVVVCVINVILDFILGFGLWGAPCLAGRGLAYASIASVCAGSAFNLFILIKTGVVTRSNFAPWKWERLAFPYFLKTALPAGGVQVLWQLGYAMLYSITSSLPYGSVAAVAGLTAGFSVEGILFFPCTAFGMTASILVGHALGAGDRVGAKQIAVKIIFYSVILMSFISLILFQFIPVAAEFTSPDLLVRDVTSDYLFYNCWAVPFTCISIVVAGIMSGAGATIYTFVIYSTATWIIRLPLAWYLGHILWQDASGVFVAMLISQIAQGSIAFIVLLRCDWYRFASTAKRFTRGIS